MAADLQVAQDGDEPPVPATEQTCPACAATMLVRGSEMLGCPTCSVVSVGVDCAMCPAAARMELGAAAPARWVRLTLALAVGKVRTVYASTAQCASAVVEALALVGGGLPDRPEPG